MGLRDITIHRTTVTYRDQEIAVRGISANDLMLAAQDYGPQIALIFGKVTGDGGFTGDVKQAIMSFTREMPEVLGATIALASDDYTPETVEIATTLPFNVQTELVEAIFHETFYSEAEVKKLIESLRRMIAAVSGVLTEATQPLTSEVGIGESGVKLAS